MVKYINLSEIAETTDENTLADFARVVAGFIIGRLMEAKIRGPREQVEALMYALRSSKQLYEVLTTNSELEDEAYKRLKNNADRAVKHFETITNIMWPV
jgi:hypothetical protein